VLRLQGSFLGFEAGSVCLDTTQIDSYLNLSEDRESKSYHVVSEQRFTVRFASNPPSLSVFSSSFSTYNPQPYCFSLPRTFRAKASAFVSFRVCSVEFVSLSSLVASSKRGVPY
jgi:hypothetical protein